ncbi:transcriptional repressor [Vannielia litorea]|uniref:Fur family transcriptional regulator, zinc uptake regulator n=1 Tax=Vannielia litorea TaxID=1217970 RepID=A0A1N6EFQ6_9RHOB|nr:transcriptional repressor [Vannielia litorea]SIN81727.1 Fur family transcriptional regulator, zinc uptake regulator [Vannielia litorea]
MSDPTGFAPHDHRACVSTALAAAEAACAARGARLTPLRRRALEILLESHKAIGAYDLLERLAAEGLGDKPPVAYRALNFLTEHGFAHRIERLNAYIACAHPEAGVGHGAAFLICRDCGRVAESLSEKTPLGKDAREAGFTVEDAVIEARGLCPQCQPGSAA